MNVKIDTKEKFCVIRIEETQFIDTMSAEITQLCEQKLGEPIRNVIIDLSKVEQISDSVIETLSNLHQLFYNSQASFVICCVKNELAKHMIELVETIEYAITPTESEAWDIVQMDEIERELLD